MREIRNSNTEIKNKTFAIEAAPAAMPVNPNIPATIATNKKIKVQRNILIRLRFCISPLFEIIVPSFFVF